MGATLKTTPEAKPERSREGVAWRAGGEEKRAFVKEMFAEAAPTYDLLNSVMCGRLHHRWRREAVKVLGLEKGGRALDVCCGTGDFLVQLKAAMGDTGEVVGVDFCAPMLERARRKAPGAGLSMGDACRLPFADALFDGVTVGWGLRNVPDIESALREAARVLKPGGRFVTLDTARPRGRLVGRASEFVFQWIVPLVGRAFGQAKAYKYLPQSTLEFATREQLKEAMERAGLHDVRWRDFFCGNVCLHWGVKA